MNVMEGALKLAVIIFLSLLLAGANCTFPQQLIAHAAISSNPMSSLYLAATREPKARHILSQKALENQSEFWIRKSAFLGSQDDAFELAMATDSTLLKLELLHHGAKLGHAESQLHLAMMSKRPETRMRWLTKAAEQGDLEAIQTILTLAKAQNNIALRNYWLPKAAKFDDALLIDHVKDVWKNGNTTKAIELLNNSSFNQSERVLSVLNDIESHRIEKSIHKEFQLAGSCNLVVQFIAENLNALAQANNLIDKYIKDERFQGFSVCFNSPVWIEPPLLNCSNNKGIRLSCGMNAVTRIAKKIEFTHAVVIAQNGIANVHNGIMYLDKHDDYFVFVHEFAHFAGFVDEYPLSKELAQNICFNRQAPNLVFSKDELEIADTHFAEFSVDELTLTKARTCEQLGIKAFKPVYTLTFMEFHDTGVIPEIYLNIWKLTIENPKALTPIYVNLAQWYESIEQDEQAQIWWRKYHQFQSKTL